MSVVVEISMFPMDKGESVSRYISQVLKMIKDSRVESRLTPMGTIIETDTMQQALELVEKAYDVLDEMGCNRVYAVLKFDIRKGKSNRLSQKIRSVTEKIGPVDTTNE